MISEQYKEGPDSDGSLELELGKFAKRKKLEQKSEQHGISATSELQTQGRSLRNERVYDTGHHLGSAPHHTSTGGRLGTKKKTREGITENENRNYLSNLKNRNLVQTEQNY